VARAAVAVRDVELTAIACPTSASCFVAGFYYPYDNRAPVVGRWDGTKWTMVEPPVPPQEGPHDAGGTLWGVACASPRKCFAVGSYFNGRRQRTLIERWDGARWSIAARLNPQGATSSTLRAISCASPTSCVAVGYSFSQTTRYQTLAEHWDGARWAIVPTPPFSGATANALEGVSCVAPRMCFAVGARAKPGRAGPVVERWDGKTWSVVAGPNAPDGELAAVSCVSATTCFAAGNTFHPADGSADTTLAVHWNGTTWSVMKSPNPKGGTFIRLSGVSCSAANNCFAVGGYDARGASFTLFERWDGGHWSIVAPSDRTGGPFDAVVCRSKTSCIAVGLFHPTIERWNGTKWSTEPTPSA
jgi:hypothetical protein